jgi:hypothetical protein
MLSYTLISAGLLLWLRLIVAQNVRDCNYTIVAFSQQKHAKSTPLDRPFFHRGSGRLGLDCT